MSQGGRGAVAMAVLVVAALGAGSWLALSLSPGPAGPPHGVSAVRTPEVNAVLSAPALPPGVSQVAVVRADSPRYASPGRRAAGTVPSTWEYRPSILPVIATQPGWVQVRLPERPNGSTAWLPDADVTIRDNLYRIVVNVTTKHLALYEAGKLLFSAPAGIGTPDDPTPLGQFFVAFDEQPPQPNPGYGPFILVTSAHSLAISDWEGSGDAVIGIHGPLGEDAEIGSTGARISHGCIRLHVSALQELSAVPPGTPIDIIT